MNTEVRVLPAQAVPEENLTAEPLAEIAVGDIVAIHSRGQFRLAQVEKVTPKRVAVVYTTKGAWDAAVKLHQGLLTPGRVERIAEHTRKSAASNYDFYVSESDPATAKYAKASNYKTEEQAAAERAEARAKVEGINREDFIEREVAKTREREQAQVEEAREGVERYVHVTRKSVKRQDVYGIEGQA